MDFAYSSSVDFTAYAFWSVHPILDSKIEQKFCTSTDRTSPVSVVSYCIYKQAHHKSHVVILIMCDSIIISLYIRLTKFLTQDLLKI